MRRDPTPAERVLWSCLRARQLAGWRFRQQAHLYGYIADFYCPAAKLVVECDGAGHGGTYDAHRDAVLAEQGIWVYRVSNYTLLTRPAAVLSELAALLASRADLTQTPTMA